MIFWLPALLPLAMTTANLVFWRRLEPTASPPGRLSVLIPARNEGANVDACLAAAVATEAPEIVVCDDASTDDTAVRVLAWSRRDPRIRLLTGSGPPTGWLGKAAARERLRCDATGDWLLFIDADVRLAPDAFARLGSVRPVDLLSVVSTQEVVTFGERLVLPLLHLTYVSWLFLPAIRWSRAPTVVAANGQVMLARADMLNGIEGFACVRHAVVDDMALMRAVREGDSPGGDDPVKLYPFRPGRLRPPPNRGNRAAQPVRGRRPRTAAVPGVPHGGGSTERSPGRQAHRRGTRSNRGACGDGSAKRVVGGLRPGWASGEVEVRIHLVEAALWPLGIRE